MASSGSDNAGGKRSGKGRRLLRAVLIVLLAIGILVAGLLGALALFYQIPGGPTVTWIAALGWAGISIAALVALVWYRSTRLLAVYAVLFALVLGWWTTVSPSNDRDWANELAQMTTGTVQGNRVTLANVRNFDWRTEQDYTQNWETRSYDLDRLVSVDMILSYWASPAIAHTLISFGFSDGNFVTFSVEIRKEKTESFSEIGGFFKEFETSVVAADERDIVRLRTNVRKEDVYLYRIAMPQPAIRSLFLSYVTEANELAAKPRFYHTITANCTTVVYAMVDRIVPGLPLDYRLLLSGYLPDYIHAVGGLTPGFAVDALRSAGAVSAQGQAAGNDPDYSHRIRQGVPGIVPTASIAP